MFWLKQILAVLYTAQKIIFTFCVFQILTLFTALMFAGFWITARIVLLAGLVWTLKVFTEIEMATFTLALLPAWVNTRTFLITAMYIDSDTLVRGCRLVTRPKLKCLKKFAQH